MALTLRRFSVQILLKGLQSNPGNLSMPEEALDVSEVFGFKTGAGANQIHSFWQDRRTLTAGSTDNLDFAGGVVSGLSGAALTYARLKLVFVRHRTPAASAALKVGGHATVALADLFNSVEDMDTDQPSFNVRPGSSLLLAARDATGYVVTATTADMLKITNGAAGSISYDIVVAGCTS